MEFDPHGNGVLFEFELLSLIQKCPSQHALGKLISAPLRIASREIDVAISPRVVMPQGEKTTEIDNAASTCSQMVSPKRIRKSASGYCICDVSD
jgi:hypothetical protein